MKEQKVNKNEAGVILPLFQNNTKTSFRIFEVWWSSSSEAFFLEEVPKDSKDVSKDGDQTWVALLTPNRIVTISPHHLLQPTPPGSESTKFMDSNCAGRIWGRHNSEYLSASSILHLLRAWVLISSTQAMLFVIYLDYFINATICNWIVLINRRLIIN